VTPTASAPHPGCAHAPPPAHPPTTSPRLAEGKTKNELMRCVKRYMAREIFHASKHQAEEPPNSLPEHRSIRDQGGGQLKVADGTTAIVWKIAACVARGVIESTKPTDEPLSQNPSPAILGLWFLNFGGWEPLPRVAPSQQSFILEGRTQTALAVYASSAPR
jgi:hypothetical protein